MKSIDLTQKPTEQVILENMLEGLDPRTSRSVLMMHANFTVPFINSIRFHNRLSESKRYLNSEALGRLSLLEVAMTPDQINQAFSAAEKGATDAGGNRTLIGKAADLPAQAKAAVQNLLSPQAKANFEAQLPKDGGGPVDGFEEKAKAAAAQIQDPKAKQSIMQLIKDGAKNPIVQGLVLTAVGSIAAVVAGPAIAGLGMGALATATTVGAVVGGLTGIARGVMQQQGLMNTLKQGAMGAGMGAAGAGIGQWAGSMAQAGMAALKQRQEPSHSPSIADQEKAGTLPKNAEDQPAPAAAPARTQSVQSRIMQQQMGDTQAKQGMMNDFAAKMGLPPGNHQATFQGGVPVTIDGQPVPQNLYTPQQQTNIQGADYMRRAMAGQLTPAEQAAASAPSPAGSTGNKFNFESRNPYVDKQLTLFEWGLNRQLGQPRGGVQLTHAGVQKIFELASIRIVTEAFSDLPGAKPPAGGAAPVAPTAAPAAATPAPAAAAAPAKPGLLGKAANWLKTKGKNLTTKITADKLNSAWEKAGSNPDSEAVAQVMQSAGVAPEVVAGAFKQAGVPAPTGAAPAAPPAAAAAPAKPSAAIGSNLAGGEAPAAAPAGNTTPKPGAATAQSSTGGAQTGSTTASGGAATPKPGAAAPAKASSGRDINAGINQTAKAQGMDPSGRPVPGSKAKVPTPTSAPQAGALATASAKPAAPAGGASDPRDTNGDGTVDATEKSIARNAAKAGKGAAPAATPTAAPAGAGAFGAMAGQLGSPAAATPAPAPAPAAPTTSSTGGTITPTATGMVHTAKPAATAPAPKPTQAELDADNERLASGTMEGRRNRRGKKVTVQEELINEYEAFLMKQYENTRNHSTRGR